MPVEDSWAAMVRLVQEGKVRAIGVSNFDVALLSLAPEHLDEIAEAVDRTGEPYRRAESSGVTGQPPPSAR